MTFFVDNAYNTSVTNTRLLWTSFVYGLTVGSFFVGAETKSQNAPTPPPGYKTRLEIMVAFGNGKLEIVERNVLLPDGVVLEKDIEYGNAGGHSLQLHLYRPAIVNAISFGQKRPADADPSRDDRSACAHCPSGRASGASQAIEDPALLRAARRLATYDGPGQAGQRLLPGNDGSFFFAKHIPLP